MVVAYIQTKARKIVLPMAILRNARKCFCGIFGAEYKKVIIADKKSQNQCFNNKKKKIAEPIMPIRKSMVCIYRYALVQPMRSEGISEWEVRYQ